MIVVLIENWLEKASFVCKHASVRRCASTAQVHTKPTVGGQRHRGLGRARAQGGGAGDHEVARALGRTSAAWGELSLGETIGRSSVSAPLQAHTSAAADTRAPTAADTRAPTQARPGVLWQVAQTPQGLESPFCPPMRTDPSTVRSPEMMPVYCTPPLNCTGPAVMAGCREHAAVSDQLRRQRWACGWLAGLQLDPATCTRASCKRARSD